MIDLVKLMLLLLNAMQCWCLSYHVNLFSLMLILFILQYNDDASTARLTRLLWLIC
jgi:hypothetical protein